jgi:ankyrin repeat/BTB/POZ domain-containing protein 1
MANVIRKHELELAQKAEQQAVLAGFLKEDNPLDLTPGFNALCEACRKGDLKAVHESFLAGVNVNGRDLFDYTPLILVTRPSCLLLARRPDGY